MTYEGVRGKKAGETDHFREHVTIIPFLSRGDPSLDIVQFNTLNTHYNYIILHKGRKTKSTLIKKY